VALASEGLLREAVDVIDICVGGFALASPLLATKKPGDKLRLHVTLGAGSEGPVEVVTRWTSADGAGVELVDPSSGFTQELARYIAELLERGEK
jgi:hypothetical protein